MRSIIIPPFLTSAQDRCWLSASHFCRFSSEVTVSGTHCRCIRGCVSPRAGLDFMKKIRISHLYLDSNPLFLGRPARSLVVIQTHIYIYIYLFIYLFQSQRYSQYNFTKIFLTVILILLSSHPILRTSNAPAIGINVCACLGLRFMRNTAAEAVA
jgi:hypothetical protein